MQGHRRAKRHVEYPNHEASPAKRARQTSLDSAENLLPKKRVATKSFYGGGKGRYLDPLERRDLQVLKSKSLSPPGTKEQDDQSAPKSSKKSTPSDVKKVVSKNKKVCLRKKVKSQSKPAPKRKAALRGKLVSSTSTLQEVLSGTPKSPVRNKIPMKEETRVYSPSRSSRKFFKSRRLSDTSGQPSAVVQKNNLHLKYKPTGIVNRSKDETKKPKLLLGMTLSMHSPSTVEMLAYSNSPASNTRSSPHKQHLSQGSQSSGRSTIPSSKNPGSQELFSPSDWDFEDDNDIVVPFSSSNLNKGKTVIQENPLSQSVDSGKASRESELSNVSMNGDSVTLLSEFSDDMSMTSELSSRDQSDISTEVNTSPTTKDKVYSIFKTRTTSGSVTSSPSTQLTQHSRQHMNGPQSTAKMGKSTKLRSLVDKSGKEQLTLDFGQRLKGAVQCDKCGMTYSHGQPSDEAMHKKFHDKLLAILKFPGWKNENVLQEFMDGSRIIVVMADDKKAIKKVAAVKNIVDEDLGFVVDSQGVKPNSKAYRVVADRWNKTASQDDGVARPWCCSTEAEKARCGINRIWVLTSDRRHGIASKLLDCVSVNFLLGFPLKKTDLAFTDPTPDGRAFASKYTGTPCFLVYKHSSL